MKHVRSNHKILQLKIAQKYNLVKHSNNLQILKVTSYVRISAKVKDIEKKLHLDMTFIFI